MLNDSVRDLGKLTSLLIMDIILKKLKFRYCSIEQLVVVVVVSYYK